MEKKLKSIQTLNKHLLSQVICQALLLSKRSKKKGNYNTARKQEDGISKLSNLKAQSGLDGLKKKKKDPNMCFLQKTHFSFKDT